jgi:tripeptide aminopeptidase
MEHISERFMRYVQIDTTADPNSTSFPSSMKQKDLGKLLVEELKGLGVADAEMDEFGYVFGTVASTVSGKVPTICFCSHMDTAPDCSGTNIKPILHKNYDGTPITLPDDKSQVITTDKHKYLKSKIGDDLITASGHTLLGADDKAGVAIIMDYVQTVMNDKNIPHGDIRILFTPDEEVGRGVDHLDMKKLNADFGYTLDGGPEGSIENESFSADAVSITIEGISTHPGYAKGKLVNSIKVMSEFMDTLPKGEWSPETTEKREGFVHHTKKMMDHAKRLKSILDATMAKYPALTYKFEQTEQYRNMREMLDTVSFVTEYAIQAMKNIGIDPKLDLIRGGTDGSRLSFMGLPCPNIFTGEMAIHSRHEYVSVQDMEKAVKTLVELSNIWTKHT